MRSAEPRPELFREIFDHAFDAILMIDPVEDRVVDANRSALEMLGRSLSALRAEAFSDLVGPYETSLPEESGDRWVGPLVFRATGDRSVATESSIASVDADGRRYLIVTARQVPELAPDREADAGPPAAGPQTAAGLAAMSELVTSLADALNQPLTAIALNVRVLQRVLADDEALSKPMREALADIVSDSHRAGDTLWSLLEQLRAEERG